MALTTICSFNDVSSVSLTLDSSQISHEQYLQRCTSPNSCFSSHYYLFKNSLWLLKFNKKKKKPEKIVKRWLDNGKLGWVLVVFAQEVRFLPESYMIAQWVTVMLQYWLDYITVIFGTKIKVGGNLCFHFFLTVTLYLAHFNNIALLILNILFFTFTLQQLLTVYLFIVFILLLHSLKKNTRWLI